MAAGSADGSRLEDRLQVKPEVVDLLKNIPLGSRLVLCLRKGVISNMNGSIATFNHVGALYDADPRVEDISGESVSGYYFGKADVPHEEGKVIYLSIGRPDLTRPLELRETMPRGLPRTKVYLDTIYAIESFSAPVKK